MLQHIENINKSMDVIKAKEEDISGVMHLLSECITDMQAQGIDQWDESYPTEDMVAEDVKNQTLHVVKYEEHLVATITIDAKGAPEYHAVKWLSEDGKSLFVHRLAVHPRWHRQKIAAGLMDFARSLAVENGCTSIRLDVYSGNPRAVKFYESCGYIRTGQVYFRNKKPPFLCYEKILTKEI